MTGGVEGARVRAIQWPRAGAVEVVEERSPLDPRDGEVIVDVAVTVTSTGTERARFRSLPTAEVQYPHRPGFMAAGLAAVGNAAIEAGTPLAVRNAPHQSRTTARRANVHAIPPGVDLVDGALWHLGLVALYGLRRGGYSPHRPLAIVGAGLVGAIVRRLALAMGTPECLVVASSDAKRWTCAPDQGTRFAALTDDALDEDRGRYPLTIDATGEAAGLELSAALTEPDGCVVLLGSPRAEVSALPVSMMQDRALRVIGAHVGTLKGFAERADADLEAELTETFFGLLAGGVSFGDLIEHHRPDEAGNVYEVSAERPGFVAAAFDWSKSPSESADVSLGASVAQPVRFALIGCGDVGARNASALDQAPGVTLTTTFDPMSAVAQDLADKYSAVRAGSLEDAVMSPTVDAVLVATPHDTHEEIVSAALRAGKHVLLEKPLAADLPAAVRIARLAQESTPIVAVLFPMRSDRRFVRALEAVRSGPENRPCGAAATYLIRKPPRYFSGGYSNRSPSTWRQSATRAGGGVVIMNVLHHLDAVRALIGSEAETVMAQTTPSLEYEGIEDVAGLIVDFGGTLATFVGAASAFAGSGERIELWSATVGIRLLPDGAIAHADGRHTVEADLEPVPGDRSRVDFIAAFADGVRTSTQPPVVVEEALAVQAIVTAAYLSAAERRTVSISDVLREAGWP